MIPHNLAARSTRKDTLKHISIVSIELSFGYEDNIDKKICSACGVYYLIFGIE